ncbi:MAG TPA: 4Fe-4S double cluster binding domain-containing protein [Anaerovoracaceae bacterium]|nr:4Fe-4S double cluster binding domain-containing protein [Anaerovoracaceae bacterium]
MNKKELDNLILNTYNGLENNNFATLGMQYKPMWEAPLIGVAAGDDKYFDFLKEHIGAFHWSPIDAFQLKYIDTLANSPAYQTGVSTTVPANPSGVTATVPANLRVVSIAFPQTMETKETQMVETRCPSRNWIVSRGEWEPLLKTFSGRLISVLETKGIRAVSIDLQHEFSVIKTGPLGLASTWSHRHYAYAAGLGTFGLSDGLITKKGKAVRFTSLIIEAPVEITERPYTSPYDWCLFYKNGSCGKCINRCPVQAISFEGHDKNSCLAYEDYFAEHYWPDGLDRKDYILGCGLCQVGIPCQNKRPG